MCLAGTDVKMSLNLFYLTKMVVGMMEEPLDGEIFGVGCREIVRKAAVCPFKSGIQ
jgi:hypothetical protein